jgi:hypothetical protein
MSSPRFSPRPQFSPDDLAQAVEEAQAVPELFEAAVREFAQWIGLDAQPLIEGHTFELGGTGFTLLHYGALDRTGATLAIDLGEFPPGSEAMLFRLLLEHNLRTPAGLHGYYALAPGRNRMQFCMRIDLARAENGADAIGAIVTIAATSMQAMSESLMHQLDAMQGRSAANRAAFA